MKKVSVKNFIREFIFLVATQTLSIGKHGLTFIIVIGWAWSNMGVSF